MSAPVIAFFGNKSGVGKTSLVYHLAWMMARMGLEVVAADLDPQADLTSNLLDEEKLENLWSAGEDPALNASGHTIYGSLAQFIRGAGDIGAPAIVSVGDRISLLPGDLMLSSFEDELSSQWPRCLDGDERAFQVISAFWRLITDAAQTSAADVVLVDVGPNLDAINRSVMVAVDHVVIPLAPDLLSLRGVWNLGPTLREWRRQWVERLQRKPAVDLELPTGEIRPAGYVVLGHGGGQLGQSVNAYQRWMGRIPGAYRGAVLDLDESTHPTVETDPYCLAQLKHYRSLMPLSYEARKPVFALKPADGAFGGHQAAVTAAGADFAALARRIIQETGVAQPR